MTRASWADDVQRKWLESRVPAFVEAQQNKSTSTTFFPDTHKAWQEAFPTPEPTEKEIEESKGNRAAAVAKKRKYWEKRVLYWFHNHTRGSSSGTGTRGLLKLQPKNKLLQPWQAYQNLFYNSKLKPLVESAWETYRAQFPMDTKPPKTRFAVMNELIQELYAAETEEVREQVEAHRQKLKEKVYTKENGEAQNQLYQSAIDKLPRTLLAVSESIVDQTGWNISILVGGPSPRLGGKIVTYMIHLGQNVDAETFEEFLGQESYEECITSTFDDYLNESFSITERESRSLNIRSKEATPVRDDTVPKSSGEEAVGDETEPGSSKQANKARVEKPSENESISIADRSPNIGSKESTPTGDDSVQRSSKERNSGDKAESGSSKRVHEARGEKLSEYEVEKRRNLQKNAELLQKLDDEFARKHGISTIPQPPPKTKTVRKKKEKKAPAERRTSSRLSSDSFPSSHQATPVSDAHTGVQSTSPSGTEDTLPSEPPSGTTSGETNATSPPIGTCNITKDATGLTSEAELDSATNSEENSTPGAGSTAPINVSAVESAPASGSAAPTSDNSVPVSKDVLKPPPNPTVMPEENPAAPKTTPESISMPSTGNIVMESAPNLEESGRDNEDQDGGDVDMNDIQTNGLQESPESLSSAAPLQTEQVSLSTPDRPQMELAPSALALSTTDRQSPSPLSTLSSATAPPQSPNAGDYASWMVPMVPYLHDMSQDVRWRRLVECWIAFERKEPLAGRISAKARPEEVAWWIKRHKQPTSVPKVKVSEFGTEWNGWWGAMQPLWRHIDEGSPLSRDAPVTEDWDSLSRGGSTGLFLVVMALSWWFLGYTSAEPTNEFWSAVGDVTWVLETITNVLPIHSVGQKRPGEEEDIISNRPGSKRARSA